MAAKASARSFTAAIIGHTGRGNYGHDLDLVFNGRANVKLLAVADPDSAGRERALARTGALRGYADYREMLEKEKPQLVVVAPRWTDQHHAMGLAALRAGAHVMSEKPFTRTLAEADELLRVAAGANLRIAVAHQMRLAPNILFLRRYLEQAEFGTLLAMHAHGKQDARAGGEDLIVLGVHLFDLMRFFAGDALWCHARVLQNGREITPADARPATENIGRIAGDEVLASFAFPQSVEGTFTSRGRNRESAGPWGIELIGSKRSVRILADIFPRVFQCARSAWGEEGRTDQWRPIEGDPTLSASGVEKSVARANARVVDDWIEAIVTEREPACSGYAGMKAVEMATAVFASGLRQARVQLPLVDRRHPLED